MKSLEKLSEGGLLATAIILSSIWLAAVPFIYLLLKTWKKKKKANGKELDKEEEGESEDTL